VDVVGEQVFGFVAGDADIGQVSAYADCELADAIAVGSQP
jgi:hypothetical protein